MENKELNLCEILKDCPKGTKLYTPLYGVCSLCSVDDKFVTVDYVGTVNIICYETFFPNGAISKLGDECLLFPSKDNRDWSTFKTKKERFDPNTLNMKLNEYQEKAQETSNYSRPNQFLAITYCSLGLTGEAGEVANKVKKIFRDDNGVCNPEKLRELMYEVGDCLWYIAMLAKECGYTLEDVAQMNYEKLHSRAERGKIGGSGDHR